MDPSNCVGLYHWARDLGVAGLADCALRYICQHFAEVGIEYNEQQMLLLLRAIWFFFF